MIIYTDPAVQSAIITTAGTAFATVVAAICASVIGKRFDNAEKLKEKQRIRVLLSRGPRYFIRWKFAHFADCLVIIRVTK